MMLHLKLRTAPAYYDDYGQPCYATPQAKGLSEFQDNQLIKGALADGYTAAVAATLFRLVKQEVLAAARPGNLDVLEIGGGDGRLFDALKEEVGTYINIEPGLTIIDERALARLNDSKYQVIKCSAEEIPLYDGSVDIVIAVASFDHIPDYRRALAEVRRLLREGGAFILVLNNRRSWWKLLLSRTEYLRRREEEVAKEHYFQWSLSGCAAHLSEFLTVKRIYSETFFPYVPRVWRYVLPVFDLLGRGLIPRYGANIIAVCKKSDGGSDVLPTLG